MGDLFAATSELRPRLSGALKKMRCELAEPVAYFLRLGEDELGLNEFLGRQVRLRYSGAIHCLACAARSNKSYGQGYCYPCFKNLARCDLCVVSPDRCHYHLGTCREPAWGEEFCMQPHYVYLANSSGIKVGITGPDQIPTRWIDQGAVQGIVVLRVGTRQQSGFAELLFKKEITDRTQWQRMLKADDPLVDMIAVRDDLFSILDKGIDELRARFGIQAIQTIRDGVVQEIKYPVRQYPTKVVSMSFNKTATIQGILMGIKGQYLLFDTGVINLRKFTSYEVEFSA